MNRQAQKGSTLLTALAMLSLISLLALVGIRLTILEQRLLAYDRRYITLFNAAEAGLREAETHLQTLSELSPTAGACPPDHCLLDRPPINDHYFDQMETPSIQWTDGVVIDWYALPLPLHDYPDTLFLEVNSRARLDGQSLLLRSVIALDAVSGQTMENTFGTDTNASETSSQNAATPRGRQSWTIVSRD